MRCFYRPMYVCVHVCVHVCYVDIYKEALRSGVTFLPQIDLLKDIVLHSFGGLNLTTHHIYCVPSSMVSSYAV